MIPAFTLPGPDGMPHGPWDYKQKEHLVLLLTRSVQAEETPLLLQRVARVYALLRAEACATLAITPSTVLDNLRLQKELHLPFALLADPQGRVIARFTRWDSERHDLAPSVLLVDRYGELYQQWIAERAEALPTPEELLDCLQYLNRLCCP